MNYQKGRVSISLHLTGLNWILIRKPNSVKMLFLFQWNMPSIEHFIINQK